MKLSFVISFILIYSINSDFLEDNYDDIMNCINTDKDSCSSTSMKTQNLECCLMDVIIREEGKDEETYEHSCGPFFTTYVSQNMMKQVEAISVEYYGIIKAYSNFNLPIIKEDIACKSSSASYKLGGYSYSATELEKLKSKNHCLYYYYNSIGENLFSDEPISIDKNKCINAESLDVTKNADIYCAYADVAILYSDGTKSEFKTCYFLPSESTNSGQLDPTTEGALQGISQREALKNNKVVQEFDATLIDKKGRTITYNSIKGITSPSSTNPSIGKKKSDGKYLGKISNLLILCLYYLF